MFRKFQAFHYFDTDIDHSWDTRSTFVRKEDGARELVYSYPFCDQHTLNVCEREASRRTQRPYLIAVEVDGRLRVVKEVNGTRDSDGRDEPEVAIDGERPPIPAFAEGRVPTVESSDSPFVLFSIHEPPNPTDFH